MSVSGEQVFRFGEFELNPRERRLSNAGKAISLTPKVFDMLVLLVERVGHIVSRDELMKALWPRGYYGCPRIAQQIAHAFGIQIHKDVVRRILARYFKSPSGTEGPSWLTLIGELTDGLWSVDLLQCESIGLKSYGVTVVMDLFTRRIVGLSAEPAHIDGVVVCRMFNQAIAGQTVPFVPCSHPFIERLIGTLRRKHLEHVIFWNRADLLRKLGRLASYYNEARAQRPRGPHSIRTTRPSFATNRRSAPVLLARTLPRLLPHTHRRLINNSPSTGAARDSLWWNSRTFSRPTCGPRRLRASRQRSSWKMHWHWYRC